MVETVALTVLDVDCDTVDDVVVVVDKVDVAEVE